MKKKFVFIGLFLIIGSLLSFYVSNQEIVHFLYSQKMENIYFLNYPLLIVGIYLLLAGLGISIPLPGISKDTKNLTSKNNNANLSWLIALGAFGIILCSAIYYIFNFL